MLQFDNDDRPLIPCKTIVKTLLFTRYTAAAAMKKIIGLTVFSALLLVCTGLVVLHRTRTVIVEEKRITRYHCEQCKNPTSLNAPVLSFDAIDKTNNAKNFSPVIISLSPNTYIPTIETERLLFRQISMADLQPLHEILACVENAQSNTWKTHKDITETKEFIADMLAEYQLGKAAVWAVIDKTSGAMIGTARFVEWVPAHKRAVIGWTVHSPYWSRGYGTEIAKMLIEYGMKYLNLNRIEIIVRVDNQASSRIAQKAGMSHECRFRDHWLLKDEWLTFDQYAIVRQEIAHTLATPTPKVAS